MPEENSNSETEAETAPIPVRKPRIMRHLFHGFFLILTAAIIFAWIQRREIAEDFISEYLAEEGLEVSYTIEEIGPTLQVLSDIVVGDAQNPDLTIERVEVVIEPTLGIPVIEQLRLINPRVFGTYLDGELSFGVLDPYLFGESDEPFEFPDFDLVIEDGRGLVESDFGPIALKMAGGGYLHSGFTSELAVTAPQLDVDSCAIEGASLYGTISIDADRPSFAGPLRFAQISCPDNALKLADGALQLEFLVPRTLDAAQGIAVLEMGRASFSGNSLGSMRGTSDFTVGDDGVTAVYEIEGVDLAAGELGAGLIGVDGAFRAADDFEQISLDGEVTASGLRTGDGLDLALLDAAKSAEGTLLAPILAQIGSRASAELQRASLTGGFAFRQEDGASSLVIPRINLKGTSGTTLAELTRGQVGLGSGAPLFSGDFITAGEGLPRLKGSVALSGNGGIDLNLSMAPYSAEGASLSVPKLSIEQSASGNMLLSGEVLASGAIPGGSVRNLAVPIIGNYSSAGELRMWRSCTNFAFDQLEMSGVSLSKQALTLCPAAGQSAILAYGARGVELAANMAALDISGALGDTPFSMASGPLSLQLPGVVTAEGATLTLGASDSEIVITMADFEADLGDAIGGRFAGVDIAMAAIPLDLVQASGLWGYDDGVLSVLDAELMVEDREAIDRFNPLRARNVELQLADVDLTATATLHEPNSGIEIAAVTIAHNLSSGAGGADLAIDGIVFGENLDPLELTDLALGVVANVEGVVTGSGRIDWDENSLTSTGIFATDGLDLAAAFGPVTGARGSLEFTDLLGMTTAPRQKIAIDAINPGIEVYNGELEIQIVDGEVVILQQASWPFMGGKLTMRPLVLNFTREEERAYVLEIEGLQASQFIDHMELNNLGASGVFDGTIPIIFDRQGYGRLQAGQLVSRPPGGTVSYIGDLTYEDMHPMANFAFDALRALEYERMIITMEGPLTGQLATRVDFDGVKQGEGAQQNFLTRKIANLPFRFRVRVNAPFYQLMTSLQSIYDPSAVRDPRDVGLVDGSGQVLTRETDFATAEALEEERAANAGQDGGPTDEPQDEPQDESEDEQRDEPDIQPPESETMR